MEHLSFVSLLAPVDVLDPTSNLVQSDTKSSTDQICDQTFVPIWAVKHRLRSTQSVSLCSALTSVEMTF